MKHNRVEGKLAVSRYVCMYTIPRESPVSVRPRRLLRINRLSSALRDLRPPIPAITRGVRSRLSEHRQWGTR